MALVIRGRSRCVLCNEVLQKDDDIVATPPFIPQGHDLAKFSDAAMHRRCFLKWEGRPRFEKLLDKFKAIWESRPIGVSMEEAEAWGRTAFIDLFADDSVEPNE